MTSMPPDSGHFDTTNNNITAMTHEAHTAATLSPDTAASEAEVGPSAMETPSVDNGKNDDNVIMESAKSTAVDSDDIIPTLPEDDAERTGATPAEPTSPTPSAAPGANHRTTFPYKYDPEKITLRFLFANRDGLAVNITCNPSDTVGEVKGALISVWPPDIPNCDDGDDLRLICMGKGYLSPDGRTLEDCQVPVFKTHPTPINVSVKPSVRPAATASSADPLKRKAAAPVNNAGTRPVSTSASANVIETGQGCCTIS